MRDVNKEHLVVRLIFCLVVQIVFTACASNSKEISSSKIVENVDSIETTTTVEQIVEESSTTTTVEEKITTTIVEERPTTTIVIRPRPNTTLRQEANSSGPPRNITTLIGCIAFYESTWGDFDPNVFQFIQSTWEAYGGTGSPGNAPYSRQEEIFWLAWNDAGPHHWAAQKGRCF